MSDSQSRRSGQAGRVGPASFTIQSSGLSPAPAALFCSSSAGRRTPWSGISCGLTKVKPSRLGQPFSASLCSQGLRGLLLVSLQQ